MVVCLILISSTRHKGSEERGHDVYLRNRLQSSRLIPAGGFVRVIQGLEIYYVRRKMFRKSTLSVCHFKVQSAEPLYEVGHVSKTARGSLKCALGLVEEHKVK